MKQSQKLAILLLSTLISGIGIASFFISINWFVEHSSNSSISVALVSSTCYLFILISLPYIGILCDKYSRKYILFSIYLIGIVVQVILCYILSDGISNFSKITLLLVLLLATNLISAIRATDQIARTAYLQHSFYTSLYQEANRWLEAVRQGVTFIGGGVTAFLMKNQNLNVILYFNIITFVIAIILISFVPKDNFLCEETKATNSNLSKFKIGYNSLRKLNKNEYNLLLISILPYIFVVSLNITYPAFFIKLSINNTAQYYAALSIPYGIGALFASVFNKKTSNDFKRFFINHTIIFALALVIGFLVHQVYITYSVLFLIAYCHAAIRIQRNTFVMKQISNEYISRVLSFFEMLFTFGVIIMSFILGIICDSVSPFYSWLFVAVLLMTSVAWLLRYRYY